MAKIMNSNDLQIVLGANGNLGRTLISQLAQMGMNVKGISKSGNGPEGVETIAVDARDKDSLQEAVKGASVIYHCLGVPYTKWSDIFPVVMKNLIEAASNNSQNTKIIYADNLYAYGKDGALLGPLSGDTAELATDEKGKLRSKLGKMLLKAHEEEKIKAAIVRASDFYGPGATNSILDFLFFPKVMQGKKSSLFADLSKKHSWVYLPDFAKALITIAVDDRESTVLGRIWVAPHTEPLVLKDFLNLFYEANGLKNGNNVKSSPQIFLTLAGLFIPMIREYKKVNYQMHIDWIADDSCFSKTFGDFSSTPLNQAIKETIDWYKSKKQLIGIKTKLTH
jgi:nucleoside-diphosphate-sugar epimerase